MDFLHLWSGVSEYRLCVCLNATLAANDWGPEHIVLMSKKSYDLHACGKKRSRSSLSVFWVLYTNV